MDNLARDAFTAAAITGRMPISAGSDVFVDLEGLALPENQTQFVSEKARLLSYCNAMRIAGVEMLFHGEPAAYAFTTTGTAPCPQISLGSYALSFGSEESIDPSPGTDSPEWRLQFLGIQFSLFEQLRAKASSLEQDVYGTIRRHLSILLNIEEWNTTDRLPDLHSFSRMLTFFAEHHELKSPRISISNRGFFEASWREARDKLVVFEFHPDEVVSWLVFAPPPAGSNQKERVAGESPMTKIMERVSMFGARQWIERV